MSTRVFGGNAGFTGKVESSTFCVESLEKFFIAIIIPNFSGCPPGNSGEDLDPSIVKILSISSTERLPAGIPLNHPIVSVELPLGSPEATGSPALFSWKCTCKSDLLSA
ncbi:hypothetical protein OAV20_00985 [Euryarchaeota archaeon]|nr:hypothetical protein [Euryarchaeota archaeon]